MVPQYNLMEIEELVLKWSQARGILTNGKVTTQALKLVSEVGELCDNVGKGRSIKDDIGDCLVVLINIAALSSLTLSECGSHAYNDIKDRKGHLNEHGNFIKEGDIDKTALIEAILFNSTPSLFGTEDAFMLLLNDRGTKTIRCHNIKIPTTLGVLNNQFKGKTVEQLMIFLRTIGEVL